MKKWKGQLVAWGKKRARNLMPESNRKTKTLKINFRQKLKTRDRRYNSETETEDILGSRRKSVGFQKHFTTVFCLHFYKVKANSRLLSDRAFNEVSSETSESVFVGDPGVEDDEATSTLCRFGGRKTLRWIWTSSSLYRVASSEPISTTDGADLSLLGPLGQVST